MKVLQADYYDGVTSRRHEVSVVIGGGKLKVVGREVSKEFDVRGVRRSLRIANTPRWLYLPGGGACVTPDNRAVDRLTRDQRYERLLHIWESRPIYAVFAVALVVLSVWFMVERALPAAVEQIAEHIPIEAETLLGQETLQGLDRFATGPSTLDPGRQAALRQKFNAMMYAARDFTPHKLEFRSSRMLGANAFALPSGIVVVTDDLVRLAKQDPELLGVLAHEVGHVHHRHTMRRLLETSVSALVIAGLTGDIASASSLAAAAPAVLVQAKYSRDNEREADAYAVDLMAKAKLNPRHLATMVTRLESHAEKEGGLPLFLSSHPASEERAAKAAAAADQMAEDDRKADAENEAALAVLERKKPAVLEPLQQEVLALFQQRSYMELERLLTRYQESFERDPANSLQLELAFRSFRAPGPGAEASLNDWNVKIPDSYCARLARGIFYLWTGLEARGRGFIQDTSAQNVRTMRAYLDKARGDLEASIALNGKPYLSRLSLITLTRNLGPREHARAHYDEAVKLAPQSLELRQAYMTNLEPRWGGSYAEMEAFAAAARKELADPAAAAKVAARLPSDRASERQRAGDYVQALRLYDQALRLHEQAFDLCQRSYVLTQLERNAEAFADVKLALSMQPDAEYCLTRAVDAASRVEDWREVVALMKLVIEAEPRTLSAYNMRAWAYLQLGRPELAVADYTSAANLGDAGAQLELGKLHLTGTGTPRNLEQAIHWFRRATVQGESMGRRLLDGALQQRAGRK